jgi:coatomer protein complex subunit alpha (xenin)
VDKVPVGTRKGGRLLQPPTPIIRAGNWPTLEIKKTTLEDLSSAADAGDEYEEGAAPAVSANTGAANTAWDDDFAADAGDVDMGVAHDDYDAGDDMGWGDDEGLDDLGDIGEETKAAPVDEMAGLNEISDESGFQIPPAGRPPVGCWVANSSHAADHMAAGGASSAMQLLHRQIAASDFSALKVPMIGCYLGSSVSLPGKTAKLTSTVIFLSCSDQFAIFYPLHYFSCRHPW